LLLAFTVPFRAENYTSCKKWKESPKCLKLSRVKGLSPERPKKTPKKCCATVPTKKQWKHQTVKSYKDEEPEVSEGDKLYLKVMAVSA
jgi:hypothetical protein